MAVTIWIGGLRPAAAEPTAPQASAVAAVHRAVNRIEQRSDRDAWGREDHWATPSELRLIGAGDCEDLAIAKYFALLAIGVPESQLRLLLVRLWRGSSGTIEPHLVLAWHDDGGDDPWILDNVTDRIVRLSQRGDLVARLAFDRSRWWVYLQGRALEQSTPVPLPQWHAVLARLAASR